jgi:DNA-binding protein Fis
MGKQLSTKGVPMQNGSVPVDASSQGRLARPLAEAIKSLLKSAAVKLKGSTRRVFMAETVRELGPGGQTLAERELGWNRGTIRKGMHELSAGVECRDAFCLRGRKRAEKRLPNLLDDIRDIADPSAQVDATLRTPRLYIKLTARQVRTQLIEQKNYRDKDLPKRRTISTILNKLGYRLRKVKKTNR